MSEGIVENPRLNTSASAVQGDTSSMMNDFLTADLMQKIEQLSPISSNQQIKTRMSDVIMINCDDNNSSSGSSDDNSNLYSSSDSSEELELKEDEKTKKKNKKNTNINKAKPPFALNEQLKDNINNIDIGNNIPQQHVAQKMKNFEKKFNKSFSAGVTHKNSSNDHVLFIDGGKHSHSLGGVNSNNNNNKSQVYSYYDSTSRYLSQVLQSEETEKNESKGCDSLNNSHNYIPKNFLGLGNNANLSGSNSTTSYGIEPFNKSDKDINSNNVFDGVNANNIYEYTANQYNNQFQQQLNNHFDTWNNNNNSNNVNSNINTSCNNESNLFMNKMINHNIMNQQRTPVTMRSNNGGFIDGGGMINQFIFDARPPQLQPFTSGQTFNNNIGMINSNNNNPFYFTQMQMIQQKNFMEFTNTINKQSSNNPFPSREDTNNMNTQKNNNNTAKESESTPFAGSQHVSKNNNNINYSYKNKTNVNNDIQNEDKTQQQQQQQQPSKQPHSKDKDDPKEYLLEMFGRLGWICNKCNNFNYETRNRCNRCSADKDPRSLAEIQKKNKEKEEAAQNKKKNKEQKVDWVCSHCSNLNFGFRKLCNRCQMPKTQQQSQSQQGASNK